jgi:putative inorganic carbon (HCO3(-)) transporter
MNSVNSGPSPSVPTFPADWWRRPSVGAEAAPSGAIVAKPRAEASLLGYRALLAFTVVLLLAPQNVFPVLGTLRIALLAGVVAIVSHVRDRLSLGLPLTTAGREMTLALLLLIWSLSGMPFSLWPGGSLALLLDLYLKALIVFWLVANLVDTLPRLHGLVVTLTLCTVVLAFVGISNYFSGVFGATQDRRIIGYDAGLTRNPNDLALMINLIIPMAVALLLSSASALSRVLLSVAILTQVIAVVLTFSRTGFLTLATTLGLYGIRLVRRPGKGLVMAALVGFFLGLPFLPSGYTDRLFTLSGVDADPTGSSQARWSGTLAALDHAIENPLMGAGLGMNILVLNESVGATWRSVHNTYLEYAVDLGVPGLVLFLLLLKGCWRTVRESRKSARRELSLLAEGIEISLAGFAVAAFFHPAAYEFYFFFVAGLAVATGTVGTRDSAVAASA